MVDSSPHPLTAAILAGGRSLRMGGDKALLRFHGKTLLQIAVEASLGSGLPTMVVGRDAPDGWPRPQVAFIPDEEPGLGPLGGLISALVSAHSSVLALACDTPLITREAVTWLVGQVAEIPGYRHGIAVQNGPHLEPLFSVYHPEALAVARERVVRGKLSLHGMISESGFAVAPLPVHLQACLRNVNTIPDWEHLTESQG